jgi:DeoR/GlpR family transcriptional regulator of sugar metabolism
MNRRERSKYIFDYLDKHYEMTVQEGCALTGSSPATIRRDFNELTEKSLVNKIWGGISGKSGSGINHIMLPVAIREAKFAKEKRMIAEKAAVMVKDGDVVIIDGGTTTLAMAPFLANRYIRIITNSILLAHQVYKERESGTGAEVFLTGGLLFPDSGLLVGPQTSQNIMQFNADLGFLSVGGINQFFTSNSDQAIVANEKAIIEQSEKTVVLADHSKFGKKDMCKMCDITELDILITDKKASSGSYVSAIRKAGVEVIEVI